MSRQKTKVREWLERQDENGDTTEYESESLARSPSERVRGKLARITRYRLAPLVELPAWGPNAAGDEGIMCTRLVVDGRGFGSAVFGPHSVWTDRGWKREWFARTAQAQTSHSTADEARAACETRLRELGFRVAKPSKPIANAEQRLGRSLSGREKARLTGPERDVVAKAKKGGVA